MIDVISIEVRTLSCNEIITISGGGVSEVTEAILTAMGTAYQTVVNYFSEASEQHAENLAANDNAPSVLAYK